MPVGPVSPCAPVGPIAPWGMHMNPQRVLDFFGANEIGGTEHF